MPITALPTPPSRSDPANFSTRADTFLGALPVFTTEANLLQTAVNISETAAAASAAAAVAAETGAVSAAGVSIWVSGTTYAIGNNRFSPINFLTYRRKTAGAGTTDPSADPTNWQLIIGQGDATLSGTQTFTGAKTFSNTLGINSLTFNGTAQRITGDFSNATITNRVLIQTSTANSPTRVGVIPSGTGNTCVIEAYNNSNPTNAGNCRIVCTNLESRLDSNISGSGTYVPLTFYTNGLERMRINVDGYVGIGGVATENLHVWGATNSAIRVQAQNGFASFTAFSSSTNPSFVFFGNFTNGEQGRITVDGTGISFRTSVLATERLKIDSAGEIRAMTSLGIGYGTGSGGTVNQITSKTTAVSLNKASGQITMSNASLSSGGTVSFRFNNTLFKVGDILAVCQGNGGTQGAYQITCSGMADGVGFISVRNGTVNPLSEAVTINFALIKGSTV